MSSPGVKYRSVVAIESCIDLGRHLVASEALRAPRDYADVFTRVEDLQRCREALAGAVRDA